MYQHTHSKYYGRYQVIKDTCTESSIMGSDHLLQRAVCVSSLISGSITCNRQVVSTAALTSDMSAPSSSSSSSSKNSSSIHAVRRGGQRRSEGGTNPHGPHEAQRHCWVGSGGSEFRFSSASGTNISNESNKG